MKFMQAKKNNSLVECQICFDNLLIDEMVCCEKNHLFCR